MKKGVRFLQIALASAAITLIISCGGPAPADLLRSYFQAYNHHEVDKVMNLLADDMVFEVGEKTFSGKPALRALAQFDSTLNIHLVFSDFRMAGDTLIFRAFERNDWLDLLGIGERDYWPCKALVQDRKFKWMSIPATRESQEALERSLLALEEWAAEDHMREYQEIKESGLNIESAQKRLALAREWREEIQH